MASPLKQVRFLKFYGAYNPRELAAFEPEMADKLIAAKIAIDPKAEEQAAVAAGKGEVQKDGAKK